MAEKDWYTNYGIPLTSRGYRNGARSSHITARHSESSNPHIRAKSEHRGEVAGVGFRRNPQPLRAKPFGSHTDLRDLRPIRIDHQTSRKDGSHHKQQKGQNEGVIRHNPFPDRRELHPRSPAQTSASSRVQTNSVRHGRREIQPVCDNRISNTMHYNFTGGTSDFLKNPKRSDSQSSSFNIGMGPQRNNWREQAGEHLYENKPRMEVDKTRTRRELTRLDHLNDSGSTLRSEKPDSSRTYDPKNTQGSQARDAKRGFQGERKLDYRALREISWLEPSEIIMKLAAPRSGFSEVLNRTDIPRTLVELILEVLNKASGCRSSRQNLLHLLGNVQGSAFMKQVLPFYLLGADKVDQHEQLEEMLPFISYILALLLELISIFPSSCATEVSLVETLLQKAISQLCSNGISIPDATTKHLANLQTFLQHLQEKKREGTLRSDNYTYLQGNEDSSSTSDFRQMTIFPTHDDIFLMQNPVMRPNIVSEVYPDATAYLDTHFRLLREDFIRPLRDGIRQILSLQGKELMRAKLDDIRVYFNAVIIMSVCTHAGIVEQVQFSIKNLKGIRWESSKRLLFGALVCLSKDNFETMLFATVADRNEKELAKGIITLKFTDESRLSLAKMKSDDTFLMVETNAYFEAYRHVLEGLKEMGGSEIPLQKYIVRCEADVLAPAYLTQNRAEYTLKTLVTDESLALKQIPDSNSSDEDSSSGDDSRNWNQSIKTREGDEELSSLMERLLGNLYTKKDTECLPSSIVGKPGARFDVLDFKTWPSKEALKLDRSQMKAFQMALTKELSIIQGPPGTGKTYVGMKIVKALLANSKVWSPVEHRPILVVCYTNHALDQFLEGIHAFLHSRIVRVGSRSNSEMMKACNLASLLKNLHTAKAVPGHLRAMYAELKDERSNIESKICEKAAYLKAALVGLLQETILEQYISDKHRKSLQSVKAQDCLGPNSSVILEWLGVSGLCKTENQPAHSSAYYEQSANGETLLSQIKQLENTTESTEVEESSVFDEEEERDLINVAEEAELVQTERMMENDDIRKQILEAHTIVAREHAKIRAIFPQLNLDDDDDDDKGEDFAGSMEDGPWEIPKVMKKRLKHLIKQELKKTHHMDEEISEEINDLWQLTFPQRWELYRFWRAKHLTNIRCQISTFENQYQRVTSRINELRNQEELLILRKAWIIGMTTTGAAKYRKVLQDIRPKIIIVEEAAEVLEAHVLTTLSPDCEHLILIGDHQQLRPSANVYELAKNFNLEVSMFERLVKMNIQYVRLDYQHRMRPEIAQLLTPHIYEQLENHSSVYKYDKVKGVFANLFFVEHEKLEEHIQEGKSHKNVHEATFVVSLCRYFICQGYEPSQITVLTTYSGQLFCLKSLMPKAEFDGVRVCVVDKYQGEENEIIILSLVRSNLEGRVGFLQIPNRICVALSRAKRGLFCIGNMQMLSRVPLWRNIMDVLSSKGHIGNELKLCCENHPNTDCYVSKAEDFSRVPEGGCMVPCEYRLACGHVCTLACHPYDAEHKKFKCKKPCPKTLCEMGHTCRKLCYEICGPCKEVVKKEIPRCGHIQDVQCSEEPSKFVCQERCTKMLPCGHSCVRSCGNSCTRNCPQLITVELECGHSVSVMCYVKMRSEHTGEKISCFTKCPAVLECGHRCSGSCSECSQGTSHVACKTRCDHILICTHHCTDVCSAYCTCCLRTCENKCFHNRCNAKCSDPCQPCTKPCEWKCKHSACTKLCWELCDREPCDMPCSKSLKCGHPCVGMCGEPCPRKCRVCNSEEVAELFFGQEANPESRFVQLRECSHIFEVSEFTKWMNQKENNDIIRLKTCPKCLIPIRHNIRYGSVVKETLSDIETVKRKIVQAWVYNLEEFLSEKEELLKYFTWLSETEQHLMDSGNTIRSVLVIGEKLNCLFKLGSIKKKAEDLPPQYKLIVSRAIKDICDQVKRATSKADILMQQNAVFRAALLTDSLWVTKCLLSGASNLSALKITKLISRLQQREVIDQGELQNIHETIKVLSPFPLELVALVQKRTTVLDTELLRQDQWRKCCDGHIYHSQKTSLCPQCSSSVKNEVDEESVQSDTFKE